MTFIKVVLFFLAAAALPVLCATAELQRFPDMTVIARYRTAAWGAAAAGKRLSTSVKTNKNSREAAEAKKNYSADVAQLIMVIDEICSGYRTAGITLEVSLAQLLRSEAELAGMEDEQNKKMSGSKDPERSARLKSLRASIRALRRTIAAQKLVILKQLVGLRRARLTVLARRNELAAIASGGYPTAPLRQVLPVEPPGVHAEIVVGPALGSPAASEIQAAGSGGLKKRAAAAVVYKRVVPGQTTLGVALANGISFSRLLKLNPSLKKNPGLLLAGNAVRVK